jgi:nitroimidazol reductase NimA-like FMN-containing flavoprotein (pyridoxamine 5'-phosphate oxidase superfamily)
MARPMTEREREAFLAEPRVAVLSVAGEEGRPPLAAPSFYAYLPGGAVSFFTNTQRRRARNVERIDETGRVTLTVQRPEAAGREHDHVAPARHELRGHDQRDAAPREHPLAQRTRSARFPSEA